MRKQVWIYLLLSLCFFYQVFAQGAVQFEKTRIFLAGQKINVEVADTDEKRERGLMNRTRLDSNAGMIFVFQSERILSFWMKDTLIPLDIGYFDKNKILIDVQTMQPASPMDAQPKVYPSKKPSQYALEMPEHWFSQHKVKVGARFRFLEEKAL